MPSLISSSAYGCYCYPHRHLHAVPRIAAAKSSSVLAKAKLTLPHAGKHDKLSSSNKRLEVVNDGMDRLPNPRTPWLKLCPELDTKEGVVMDAFYSVAEHRVVRLSRPDCLGVPATATCFACAGEWLVFVNPVDVLEMYLANPFFSDRDMGVIRLPPLTTMPGVAGVECDLESRSVEVRLADDVDEPFPSFALRFQITNLAISHSDPRNVDDCIAAALYQYQLAYSRIWDDHINRWTGLQEDSPARRSDNQLVFSHADKLLYTINSNGIEVFDLFKKKKRMGVFSSRKIKKELENEFEQEQNERLEDLRICTATGDVDGDLNVEYCRAYHLVMLDNDDEPGQLLLVVRHLAKPVKLLQPINQLGETKLVGGDGFNVHFDVFKVVFEGRRLVRLKTLGDHCLFVGGDNSFSLRASEYPGLRPNSIYFVCHHEYRAYESLKFHRGIFNLDTNEIEPIDCNYCAASPLDQYPVQACNGSGAREGSGPCKDVFWVSPSNIIT